MKLGAINSTNVVTVGPSSGNLGTDTFLFVSGTVGLSGSSARKVVFGGDVVVSGSITTTHGVNGWVTIDIDFSAQPSQTLGSDTTYTIAGLTWTKVNSSGDATAMAIVSGSGLVITPVSSTDWYGPVTFTEPIIEIPLATIIPNFDLMMPMRATMYVSSSNEAANYDHATLALHYGHLSASYASRRVYGAPSAAAVNNFLDIALNGARFYQGNTVNSSNRVYQISLPMGAIGFVAAALTANYATNAMPTQPSFVPCGQYSATNPLGGSTIVTAPYTGNSSEWKVAVGAGRAGSGTSYVATIKSLRVEYRP